MAAALHAAAFGVLGEGDWLHLIIVAVHEDDALSLALTCRALRDGLWARFLRRPAGDDHAGRRLRTRHAAATATPARLWWVCALPAMSRPAWVSPVENRGRVSHAARAAGTHIRRCMAHCRPVATHRTHHIVGPLVRTTQLVQLGIQRRRGPKFQLQDCAYSWRCPLSHGPRRTSTSLTSIYR